MEAQEVDAFCMKRAVEFKYFDKNFHALFPGSCLSLPQLSPTVRDLPLAKLCIYS